LQFYSDTQLGPRQSLLPSGSLVCHGVKIARVGSQVYHISELPLAADDAEPDANGMIAVWRDEAEVFSRPAMGSFEGVPVVLRHPSDGVDPASWSELSIGHAQNVRRDGDFLVADLVIHDRRGIAAIRDFGWRGVSAGYDCGYERDGEGGLRQRNIIANHVAVLGPDEAPRCGDMCAIGDSIPKRQRGTMVDQSKPGQGYSSNATMGGLDWPLTEQMTAMSEGPLLSERDRLQIVAEDMRRCRDALRAINEANRQQWGRR
jgi:hypothetical protein